jgi:hypothetical protein
MTLDSLEFKFLFQQNEWGREEQFVSNFCGKTGRRKTSIRSFVLWQNGRKRVKGKGRKLRTKQKTYTILSCSCLVVGLFGVIILK